MVQEGLINDFPNNALTLPNYDNRVGIIEYPAWYRESFRGTNDPPLAPFDYHMVFPVWSFNFNCDPNYKHLPEQRRMWELIGAFKGVGLLLLCIKPFCYGY